jgi:hypothetical protein
LCLSELLKNPCAGSIRAVTVALGDGDWEITLSRPPSSSAFSDLPDLPAWLLDKEVVTITMRPMALSQPDAPTVMTRCGLIQRYKERHGCLQREVAARAVVHPRDLQRWQAGKLLPASVKSQRIERLLLHNIRSDSH